LGGGKRLGPVTRQTLAVGYEADRPDKTDEHETISVQTDLTHRSSPRSLHWFTVTLATQ